MSLLDIFSGKPKQFVTHHSFENNLEKQLNMTPQTLAQLRQYNVTPERELKLEFFFYTNTAGKAAALASELSQMQYQVKYGASASDKKIQVVTGWTNGMPMSDTIVLEWTKRMCEVGFNQDCDFDGWGTNPEQ